MIWGECGLSKQVGLPISPIRSDAIADRFLSSITGPSMSSAADGAAADETLNGVLRSVIHEVTPSSICSGVHTD